MSAIYKDILKSILFFGNSLEPFNKKRISGILNLDSKKWSNLVGKAPLIM